MKPHRRLELLARALSYLISLHPNLQSHKMQQGHGITGRAYRYSRTVQNVVKRECYMLQVMLQHMLSELQPTHSLYIGLA